MNITSIKKNKNTHNQINITCACQLPCFTEIQILHQTSDWDTKYCIKHQENKCWLLSARMIQAWELPKVPGEYTGWKKTEVQWPPRIEIDFEDPF